MIITLDFKELHPKDHTTVRIIHMNSKTVFFLITKNYIASSMIPSKIISQSKTYSQNMSRRIAYHTTKRSHHKIYYTPKNYIMRYILRS